MKRLLRLLNWLGASLLGVVLLALFGALLLLGTEWGSRRALSLGGGFAGYTLDWQQAEGTLWEGMQFQALSVQGPALELTVQDAGLRWRPWHLVERELQVDRLWLHDVQLTLPPPAAPAEPAEPLQPEELEQLLGSLPLGIQLSELSLQALAFQQGETRFALDRLSLGLQLQPGRADLALTDVALYGAELKGTLSLQGNLDIGGQLDWLYSGDPAWRGTLGLAGNLRSLDLEHALVAPLVAQSRGNVVPGIFAAAPLALDLQHDLARLDLGLFGVQDVVLENLHLQTQGPLDALAVNGALDVAALQLAPIHTSLGLLYTGTVVELEQLQLASDELQLALSGRYDLEGSSGELEWVLGNLTPGAWLPDLALADLAGAGQLLFSHDSAGLDAELQLGPLNGSLNGYPLEAAGSVLLRDSQPDTLDLQINNGANTLMLDGRVMPELALDWAVDIRAPENFWQGLAGSLQGEGRLEGQLPVPLLNGSLQGAGLSLQLGGDRYQLAALQLAAEVVGQDANNLVLQLDTLQVEQQDGAPQTWLESATLDLRGNPAGHTLQASVRGYDSELHLALQGAQSGEAWQGRLLEADLTSPWSTLQLRAPVELQLGADGFTVPPHCWDLGPMALCLDAASRANGMVDAAVTLQGLPLSWFNAAAGETPRPPALQTLLQQYALLLPANMQLEGTAGLEARLAGLVDGAWQDLEADLQLDAVTMRMERPLDPGPLGDTEARDDVPTALLLALQAPQLHLSSDGSNWLAELELAVEQLAAIDADAGSPLFPRSTLGGELRMDGAGSLAGSLRLDFPSLDWVQALVPAVAEPRGHAAGTVQLSGTRSAPRFDAELRVREGRFRVPQLGLDIQALEADVAATPEQASARIAIRDAQGDLLLQASMSEPLADTRALQATLEGERFIVMDNAAAEVEVSPDLQLTWSAAGLRASGSFLVPRASIALDAWASNVSSGGTSPSRDAIVVVEDADALVADSGAALPLEAQLQLALGDDVRVQGLGLQARLGGELQVQQQAQRPLLVYGELSIPEGSYEIYNQTLQTRDGRLLFFGNPLDPVLDLRAFRETPNAEVGMQLGGNVSALQSSLYSTPQLPESEILSLLITGKSFRDTNQGDSDALVSAVANFGIERTAGLTSAIGDTLGLDDVSISGGSSYLDSSLGMGKYLTPELLMRYEIGLFGRQAVFSLVYSLSEHLKLEVRSGLSQSVDISYAIEKD